MNTALTCAAWAALARSALLVEGGDPLAFTPQPAAASAAIAVTAHRT